MSPTRATIPMWVKVVITIVTMTAGVVAFAFTNFETQPAHDKDITTLKEEMKKQDEMFNHIDKDLHELLRRSK